MGADAQEMIRRGDPEAARHCLAAARSIQDDPVLARDHAALARMLGRHDEALRAIDEAIALGDADPEAEELRAIILAEKGDDARAIEAADRTGTVEGSMIGALLHDPSAAYRLVSLVDEESERGALASLVLAAHEGARGDLSAARRLGTFAEVRAQHLPRIADAARAFGKKVAGEDEVRHLVRLRLGLDHATNPGYRVRGDPDRTFGLRASFTGEGALEVPIGRVLLSGALRVDQHVFATERDLYAGLDLTAFAVATRVDVAVANHPRAAVVGIATRYVDVFARLFRDHYAATLEGGPDLTPQVAAPLQLRLAFHGVVTDFVDVSPPNAIVSSLNRDRVGQRGLLTLILESDWLTGSIEGMFLRDDARGDAFDAIGGGAAGRVTARLGGGVELDTGVAVVIREYGPVGDRSIIGPASTRTEVRTVVELAARVPLYDGIYFLMEDVFIDDRARQGHAYTENVLSMALEAVW
jgi:hypothetical protein